MAEEEKPTKPRYRVSARSDKQQTRAQGTTVNPDGLISAKVGDTFQNFSLNLGLGTNNALSDSTYGFLPVTRDRTLLEWIHRGSWIVGVAIDAIADDMTKMGITITSEMPPGAIKKLEAAATKWGIWYAINDTIRWGRLYGGALSAIMIDGQDPRNPLDIERIGRGSFRGLMVFDRWMVEPDLQHMIRGVGDDSLVPRSYWVIASGSGVSFEGMRIHHSRVLRHEGVRLPYWQRVMENMWGISVVERLYDRLIAFDSATNGAAQLVYKSYIRTLKIARLREIVAAGGMQVNQLQQYVEMMRRYQGIEGITLIDSEDDFAAQVSAGTSFSGIADALIHFGQQISGALQIPLVRLFGQSPAGLNSTGESDMRNYYDGIRQRQERELRPMIDRTYRAMAKSEGIPIPEDFNFVFNPLWQLSETERATASAQTTSAVLSAWEAGLVDASTAMKELKQASIVNGLWTNITDAEIAAAKGKMPPSLTMAATAPTEPGANSTQSPNNGSPTGAPGVQPGHLNKLSGESTPIPSAAPEVKPDATDDIATGPFGVNEGPGLPIENPGTINATYEKYESPKGIMNNGSTSSLTEAIDDVATAINNMPLIDFQGLPIFLENFIGQIRFDGFPPLAADYGYIRNTRSAEGFGEGMDCFVGPHADSTRAWIVNQGKMNTSGADANSFDEHKIMLGFKSSADAVAAYRNSYPGGGNILSIRETDIPGLKRWLEIGNVNKAV
jgi:hypothetical protein